jgi:diguanylate cyclase (GGDEF)-like protein
MTISPSPAQERTNRVRTRDALSSAALNSLAVHVAVLGPDGRIVAVNDAWRRFAAENGAAHHHTVLEGADYLAVSSDASDLDASTAQAGVRSVLAGEVEEFRLEYPCHSPTELRWFELRATPLRDPSAVGAVVVHSTITQRKLAEQRLDFLAHHDELTGLANRRRMMEALAAAQPTGRLGVLLIDLDRFKAVNDTHGHAAGNEVLCAVAQAMGEPLGGGSLAGRHGGDEFCMALFDTDTAGVERAAAESCARARRRFAALPFAAAVTMSVGGTLVRPDEPLAQAMQRADEALYAAKGSGRDGHRTG